MPRTRFSTAPLGAFALLVAQGCATSSAGLPPPALPEGPARSRAFAAVSLGAVPGPLEPRVAAQALAGYGDWVDTRSYGRVWIPRAQTGFVPYGTDGSWVVTDAGWYWQSALPWGAITFHYGRWTQLDALWAWVPGSAFAPAWVDWRAGGPWVGWAPLAPRGAADRAPFVFCARDGALGAGVWQRVVEGPAATSLFPRTAPVAACPGYGGAVYAPGPGTAAPSQRSASVSAVWSAGSVLPRPAAQLLSAVSITGYAPAEAPTEFPDEPVALDAPTAAPEALADARAAVRVRDEDLARYQRGGVSVINMPEGERAALFAPRRVARTVALPALEDDVPERPAALPPPADAPLAWWPPRGPRRAFARMPAVFAPAPSGPTESVRPSSPIIGMPAWTPPTSPGVVTGQGLSRGGVGVLMGAGSVVAPPIAASPVVSPAQGVALPLASSLVR